MLSLPYLVGFILMIHWETRSQKQFQHQTFRPLGDHSVF